MSASLIARATGVIGLALASLASAATDELARCASLEAAEARLACYDALAGRGTGTQSAAPAQAAPRVSPAPAAPAAPALPAAPAAVATPRPAAAPAAAAPDSADPANFGLTAAQLKQAPPGPRSITAEVVSFGGGADGRASVTLDNGQRWSFLDQGAQLRSGDAVTIKRATLGSFLLTDGAKRSYRVKRTQ